MKTIGTGAAVCGALALSLFVVTGLAADPAGAENAAPAGTGTMRLLVQAARRGVERRFADELGGKSLTDEPLVSSENAAAVLLVDAGRLYRILCHAMGALDSGGWQAWEKPVPVPVVHGVSFPDGVENAAIAHMLGMLHTAETEDVMQRLLLPIISHKAYATGGPYVTAHDAKPVFALPLRTATGRAILPRVFNGGEPVWNRVPVWQVLGPFQSQKSPGWLHTTMPDFIPEMRALYALPESGNQAPRAWRRIENTADTQTPLDDQPTTDPVLWYAYSELETPTAGFYWMRIKAGGDWVLWINNRRVWTTLQENTPEMQKGNALVFRVHLRGGANSVMFGCHGDARTARLPELDVAISGDTAKFVLGEHAPSNREIPDMWRGWEAHVVSRGQQDTARTKTDAIPQDEEQVSKLIEELLVNLPDRKTLGAPVIAPAEVAALSAGTPLYRLRSATAPAVWLVAGPVAADAVTPAQMTGLLTNQAMPVIGGPAREDLTGTEYRLFEESLEWHSRGSGIGGLYSRVGYQEQWAAPLNDLMQDGQPGWYWLGAVLDNDRARLVRIGIRGGADTVAWLAGELVRDGQTVHLRPGLYPFVIQTRLARVPAQFKDMARMSIEIRSAQAIDHIHGDWLERAREIEPRLLALLNAAPDGAALAAQPRIQRIFTALEETTFFIQE